MNTSPSKKLEAALATYLATFAAAGQPLEGLTLYEGRANTPIEATRYLAIVASREGGSLVRHGIYDVVLELQLVTLAAPQPGETIAAIPWHEHIVEALAYIFRRGQEATVAAALAVLDDEFATPGWWVEPRRDESSDTHFITVLPFTWSVSIVPDP